MSVIHAVRACLTLALLSLVTCQDMPPNVSLPLVKLPAGFSASLYYKNAVPGIRNLVMSGNSKPNGGPIILYGSTFMKNKVRDLGVM